ncbi:MAG: TonB-dependent receptor, partial [Rhodoferax sp.]|nr:TonB-dependent receptor [Rhodoferax sp.]
MNIHSRLALLGCLLTSSAVSAEGSATLVALSERDFLGEMPVVLSVSRLAQRLDETPGAVTILDRDFIRLSGARDVADLLRVVPGFQSFTSYETDAPMAVYHGRIDDWANRIQVLVDGRSVYSGFIQGSAGLGWQTMAIDDVERIEVFRGSNSATYGARAFLGVVNIVTVAPMDALGVIGSVTAGSNGVADASARVGWGAPGASYRISMDTHGDDGLRGTVGSHRTHRVNFAGAWSLGAGEGLELRAGALNIDAGRGAREYGEWGNPARMRYMGSRFFQADWSKSWSESQDVTLSVSHTEYLHRDSFAYLNPEPFFDPYYGISISFGGVEVNDAMTLQQTTRFSPNFRTVWGAELRQELIDSPSSFDTRGSVRSNFFRLFGNAEWRMFPALLLNAGLLAEQGDLGGESVSPRIMLNWSLAEGSTLRAGFSDGFRPPSAFEKYGSVKYYDRQGKNPLTYVATNGKINSETIRALELGYHGNFPQWKLSGDVRLF